MPLKQLIDKNELKACVQLINKYKIPSTPQVLLDLKSEISSSNPDITFIIELISKDIGLSASILKTINSAQFNLSEEITSIRHAINLLGIKKLESVIIQPAYKLALNQNIEGFEDISNHSHFVGLICEIIAEYISFDRYWEPSAFYMAGLFHDVGALVLANEYSDYMEFYHHNETRPVTMLASERGNFGVGHATIGVLLAKKWGLPNDICNAIYLHHHVYGTYKNKIGNDCIAITEILKLAHSLGNMFEQGEDIIDVTSECSMMYMNAKQELMLNDEQIEIINIDIKSL